MMDVIIPKKLFNAGALERAIEAALDGGAEGVKTDFDTTTQTWKRRPPFTISRQTGGRKVSTHSTIYGYVNDGTPPHSIRPRRRTRLAFPSSYRAKTTPGVIGSSGGGPSGERVTARVVKHPGTIARNFTEEIKQKWDDRLPEQLQRAIDSAL